MQSDWQLALFGPGEFSDWSDALFPSEGSVLVLAPSLRPDSPLRVKARDRLTALGLTPILPPTDEAAAKAVESVAFVYIQGGDPTYIAEVLLESLAWKAALAANVPVATTSGSAMALGVLTVDLQEPADWLPGVRLLSDVVVAAHWDTLSSRQPGAFERYQDIPEGLSFLGINEDAAVLLDDSGWVARGPGGVVTRVAGGEMHSWRDGDRLPLTPRR
jgi:hypothetical protein